MPAHALVLLLIAVGLGGGSGQRSADPTDPANTVAKKTPVAVQVFCVAGTRGCN